MKMTHTQTSNFKITSQLSFGLFHQQFGLYKNYQACSLNQIIGCFLFRCDVL